jgi:hypothetical protein
MKALFEVVIFALDVDYTPTPQFRVIQLTPEGSSTSIQFGVGLTDAPELTERGVEVDGNGWVLQERGHR